MIIKSSNLMYIFNFDATIIKGDLSGYERGLSNVMSSALLINPERYDIRWTILTSRPWIEFPIVRFVCTKHKLYPSQIIMGNKFFHLKKIDDIFNFKKTIIEEIITHKRKVSYTNYPVTKIIYVTNNVDELKYINTSLFGYRVIAISSMDFYTQLFNNSI